jgi:hypothetical protein
MTALEFVTMCTDPLNKLHRAIASPSICEIHSSRYHAHTLIHTIKWNNLILCVGPFQHSLISSSLAHCLLTKVTIRICSSAKVLMTTIDSEYAMECAICLDPITICEKKMEMPACQHVYHTHCFLEYMKRGAHSAHVVTCPECRHMVIELPPWTHAPCAPFPIHVQQETEERPPPPPTHHQTEEIPENVHSFMTGCAAILFCIWMFYLSTRLITD